MDWRDRLDACLFQNLPDGWIKLLTQPSLFKVLRFPSRNLLFKFRSSFLFLDDLFYLICIRFSSRKIIDFVLYNIYQQQNVSDNGYAIGDQDTIAHKQSRDIHLYAQ